MIEQRKRRQIYYMHKQIKNEVGKNPTADEVLNHLLGDSNGWNDSDYVIYKYEYNQKRSLFNRLNYLWVWPLFILSIPFVWIFTGDYGLKRTSKIGSVVDWLIKFDN